MKKILFLLLLSVAMYGQVPADATPLENIQITNNVEDNVSTKVTVQNANGVQNWKFATSLPVSTATANALDLKVENSSGAIEGFAITNNGDGTVNIATGTAYLRTTNNPYSPLIKYVIPAVTNLALMDNANNFVLVDYNGGSPALTVTIAPGTINTTTNSIVYLISRVGTTLDYINLVGQNVDANGKLRRRFLNSESLRRASGVVLTASNRNLLLTAGLFYSGLIEATTPAFNTATGSTFTQAYLNGSTWVRTTGNTQINNTQYSLAGVLTTMPSNDYRVDYVYALADNPSKLYVLLGTTTYNNITNARLAPVPVDLPTELQYLGARVGRVIIQKDATTTETTSEFATIYQAGTAQLHNDLGGLNLGDFQHLTVAEKAEFSTKVSELSAPDYFYTGSLFYKNRVKQASLSTVATIGGQIQAPTNIVVIGDSMPALSVASFRDASSVYGGVNALGFNPFYGNNYIGDLVYNTTGTVVSTRNDTSSNGAWGVCGSRVDASSGATLTIAPIAKYRFDAFHLWYNKVSGGGTFTYSVDGAAAISIDTNNATEELGILNVSTVLNGSKTHTIVLTVTSGSVRFYGIDFYNKKQGGVIVHVLQSGGSKAQDWNGRTSYIQQFISTMSPASAIVILGTNDAVSGRTGVQYASDLAGVISGLSLPSTCSPTIMTPIPIGLTFGGAEDTVYGALITDYRTQALATAKSNGWSFFDSKSYWPSYTYASANAMYQDAIHPSIFGAQYLFSGLMKNIFPVFNNYNFYTEPTLRKTSILFEPDGVSGISATNNAGNGQKSESGTGLYFNSVTNMSYRASGVEQLAFTQTSNGNAILSAYPTTSTPIVFYSFRQNSTSAKAFSFDVVGSATSLNLNNAPFTINSTSLIASTLINTPALTISSTPITSAGTYDFLTRNTSTGVIEKVTSASVAPTASPTFTGDPTAPTPTLGDNDTSVATTAFVNSEISLKGYWTKTGNDITNNNSGKVLIGGSSLDLLNKDIVNISYAYANNFEGGQLYIYNGARLTGSLGVLISDAPIRPAGYTVATLPAGVQGAHAYVTDATAPTYLGALTGGGSVVCPVFYNGTNWVAH